MISQDYQNKITAVPDNPLTLARTCHDGQFSFDPPIIIAQHLLALLFSEIDNEHKQDHQNRAKVSHTEVIISVATHNPHF